jgi:hypothetical protein
MADTHNLSPEYLAADQSHKILVVAILFIVLEVLFIGIYFTSRLTTKLLHSVDTYLMIPAFLTCISHPIIALCKSFMVHVNMFQLTWLQTVSITRALGDILWPSQTTR